MTALASPYQNIIHLSRYARWNKKARRRENWEETANRYFTFMHSHLYARHKLDIGQWPGIEALRQSLYDLEALPAMRCIMAAGKMLEQEHLTGYNCSYVPIDHPRAFDEILYLLMCTCGVGFSVERQFVHKLPMIPMRLRSDPNAHIIVPDTRIGWARSYAKLLKFLWSGSIPTWDTSGVRKKGSILKTTGGTASGPEPLEQLFRFTIAKFMERRGDRLNSLDCHDIACHIGDIIMVGGVRQAALISLSNPSDQRMRFAKSGNWYADTPWRQMANNSAAYTERPAPGIFMAEWLALHESKSGERGFFNRVAATDKCSDIGRALLWQDSEPIQFGTNPCGEIILRPNQMCNLSEVVARHDDTTESLKRKVEAATIFGTWQSTLTKFKHVRPRWRKNCEDERLLGVSITGIMDCDLLNKGKASWLPDLCEELRRHAREVNKIWAEMLGIPASAAITTVKPSGTVSQLTDASSGIHARFSSHYIRRINMNRTLPMTRFMVASGFPHEPHHRKPDEILVFNFPIAAPPGAVIEGERSAIESLEHWRTIRNHWCDHNASVTISVEENEWPSVGGWVYDNFGDLGGVSFFPRSGAVYQQPPYEAIPEERFKELDAAMPGETNWEEMGEFEQEAPRPRAQEFACTANGCELK